MLVPQEKCEKNSRRVERYAACVSQLAVSWNLAPATGGISTFSEYPSLVQRRSKNVARAH